MINTIRDFIYLVKLELISGARNFAQFLVLIASIIVMCFLFSYAMSGVADSMVISGLSIIIISCIVFVALMIYGGSLIDKESNNGTIGMLFVQGVLERFILVKIVSSSIMLSIIIVCSLPVAGVMLGSSFVHIGKLIAGLVLSLPSVLAILIMSQFICSSFVASAGGNVNNSRGNNSSGLLSTLIGVPLIVPFLILSIGFAYDHSESISPLLSIVGADMIVVTVISKLIGGKMY